MAEEKINILVTATNEAGPVLAQVAEETKATGETANSSAAKFKSFGSELTGLGSSLTTGITLPIAAIGGAAATMAVKFQQAMEILHTEGGMSLQMVQSLNQPILDMAANVGIGPEKLAEAMYHIASNSKGVLTAAQMLDQLKMSAEAASMTGANLDDTTYALSSAMASGVAGFKTAADMMGILNAVVGTGDMKFQDLNAAIGTGFLATSKAFGITVQSMGAALATLTDNGMHADEAATRLRMSVSLMAAPSDKAAGVMNDLGLKTNQLAIDLQKPNGINVAMEDLKKHLQTTFGKDSVGSLNTYIDVLNSKGPQAADAFAAKVGGAAQALSQAFGGGRSDAAIMTLLSNTTRTDEGFGMINKGQSSFGGDWASQQQTAAQKLKDAWAGLQAVLIELGSKLLPTIVPVAQRFATAIEGVASWFQKLPQPVQNTILVFAGLMAVLGPVLVAFGTFITTIAGVAAIFGVGMVAAGGIAVAILALIAIAAAVIANWSAVSRFFQQMWTDIMAYFRTGHGQVTAMMVPFIGIPLDIIANWKSIVGFFQNLWSQITKIFHDNTGNFGNLGATAAMAFLGPWAAVPLQIGRILSQIGPVKTAMHDLHIPGFANGVRNFSGGLAVVGEEGPELVDLPGGSSVYPNGTGPAGGNTTTVHIGTVNLHTAAAVREFMNSFDQDARSLGKGLTGARGAF